MTKHIFTGLAVLLAAVAAPRADNDETMSRAEMGKALAFDRRKGNCLACHVIEGGDLAGNLGPPLVMLPTRYPDRERLREQVWDAEINNPATSMPPFGRHKILTEEEIDLVVDYLLTL